MKTLYRKLKLSVVSALLPITIGIFSTTGFTQNFDEIIKAVASDRAADDQFGWSVSISGDHVIVGAMFEDEDVSGGNPLSDAGSAYVFERNGVGVWSEVQKIVASDRADGDVFGYAPIPIMDDRHGRCNMVWSNQ